MKRRKKTNRFNSKSRNIKTEITAFTLLIKKIALALGILLIVGFFTLILTYEPQKKQLKQAQLYQPENLKKEQAHPPKPKKQLKYPKLTSKLKILHKTDGDTLYLKSEKLRITFKTNKLIASQKELFRESQINPNTLYCILEGVDSKMNGSITEQLKKQSFAKKVSIKQSHHQLTLKIQIKESCDYKRSAWAKRRGLDLLTFSCDE
jgi:hypothetical protein